jgi:hypothetical protein
LAVLMDKVWVWGGPTPLWGGSTEKDCAAQGARYFGAPNVAYQYGLNNEEMMETLRSFKRVLCPVSRHCRSVDVGDEVADARRISQLSCQYPNIVGGIIDDLSMPANFPGIAGKMRDLRAALRADNPNLALYGVVYAHHLETDFTAVLPHLDGVNLWVWNPQDLGKMKAFVQRTQEVFASRPILMGLFMHDYVSDDDGTAKQPVPMDLMKLQFETAAALLRDKQVEGIVILGDREIAKYPAEAEWIRTFIREQTRTLDTGPA